MRSTDATKTLLDAVSGWAGSWAPPPPWGVGFSGGRDSAVLLWALVRTTGPQNLVALHVDHGWRSEAERCVEGRLVADLCHRWGVALRSFGPPEQPSATEAGARDHRYFCFQQFLNDHPDSPVWLAHHADDQAETVLMRLLRGRSWQGLGGMSPRRGPYLRPLLGLRSSLLAEVAREQGIPFHEDSTNLDSRLTRNHLRREVFPLLADRFPRAVESLVAFASVWSGVSPPGTIDPAWTLDSAGGALAAGVWDRWTGLERQAQLLAVGVRIDPGFRASRRFLEAVTADGRTAGALGMGWRWSRSPQGIRWRRVVHRPAKEYFINAELDRDYGLGDRWVRFTSGTSVPPGGLVLETIDPGRPWVWRSAVPGMRFASADDPDWGKTRRRHRLGALDPRRCALAVQGGLIRAVVDPGTKTILWTETGPRKLNKAGIFVTLRERSDYER